MEVEFTNIEQHEENAIPRVSIGMPVYNGERFISKALDSLLGQTFSDFELIISDNASTDGTAEICRDYERRDSRIRYIRQSKNKGALFNFKFVLSRAVGPYFMWAAVDDIWDRNFLRQCVNCLDSKPDIGIVFTQFWVTSRMYPFVKLKKFPDMSFLASDNSFTRVSKYIQLEGVTHKANIIYGLWRIKIARSTMAVFNGVGEEKVCSGLDIAQISYALTLTKCFQIPSILFYKTYKRFPPGHWLSRVISPYMRWRGKQLSINGRIQRLEDHINLLRMALKRAGVLDKAYENILQEKRDRAIRQITGKGQ